MSRNVYNSPHWRFYTGQTNNKSRSTIKKTILKRVSNGPHNKRDSRRVSFSGNLFLQELKPDGSFRLSTEPFKHDCDEENNFKRRKVPRIKKTPKTPDDNLQDENTVNASSNQINNYSKNDWIDERKIRDLIPSRLKKRIKNAEGKEDERTEWLELSKMNLVHLNSKQSSHPKLSGLSYYFIPCDYSDPNASPVSSILIKRTYRKPIIHFQPEVLKMEPFKPVNTFTYDTSQLISLTSNINDFGKEIDSLFKTLSNSAKSKWNFEKENNIINYKKNDLKAQIDREADNKTRIDLSQHNRGIITFKTFNNHIKLSLELESKCGEKYSKIKDMKLVFEFDKPLLKFWTDKFFLFDTERNQHHNFILILQLILTKQFEQLKMVLLINYPTTEFLVNIEQEVESMLNKVSEFAKDVKITTLKFINSQFKIKDAESFDFLVQLFGTDKNKEIIVMNINFITLEIELEFQCELVKMNYMDLKSILNRKGEEMKTEEIVSGINRMIRGLRKISLQQSFKFAVENWDE